MSAGEGYYEAMGRGLELGGILGPHNWVPFNFRLPWIFHLWLWVGRGGISGVAALMVGLAVLAVPSSYLLARRFTTREAALLAPLSLVPLLLGVTSSRLLLITDSWAGLFNLLAVSAWVYRNRTKYAVPIAAVVGVAAVACREFSGALLVVGLLAAVIERNRRDGAIWLGALGIAAAMELANIHAVGQMSEQLSTSVSMWTESAFSIDFLLGTIRFGSGLMLHYRTIAVVAFAAALLGAIGIRNVVSRTGLTVALLAPTVFAATVHSMQYDIFNWGLVFTPLMFSLAAVGVARLTGHTQEDGESPEHKRFAK